MIHRRPLKLWQLILFGPLLLWLAVPAAKPEATPMAAGNPEDRPKILT